MGITNQETAVGPQRVNKLEIQEAIDGLRRMASEWFSKTGPIYLACVEAPFIVG